MSERFGDRSPAPSSGRVLLVEDDIGLQRQMQWALKPRAVIVAGTRSDALRQFQGTDDIHTVILDLGLPPDPDGASEGLKLLDEILNEAPQTKAIILSVADYFRLAPPNRRSLESWGRNRSERERTG